MSVSSDQTNANTSRGEYHAGGHGGRRGKRRLYGYHGDSNRYHLHRYDRLGDHRLNDRASDSLAIYGTLNNLYCIVLN